MTVFRAPAGAHPTLRVVGGLTLDGIIRADGTWVANNPGGNSAWASVGARAAGASVDIHAVAGFDYDQRALADLAALGVGTSHIRRSPDRPSLRVTFAYDMTEDRVQPIPAGRIALLPESARADFRDTTLDPAHNLPMIPTSGDLLAPGGVAGSAWHLGLLPMERTSEIVHALRAAGASYVQADCPERHDLAQSGIAVLAEVLDSVDVFLPSTSDVAVFAPDRDLRSVLADFHELGAETVVLKAGADGAIISERDSQTAWRVPAYTRDRVLDATGAGDVFCGAFGAAILSGRSLLGAVCLASSCASFATQVTRPSELLAVAPSAISGRAQTIESEVESW